jgi:hypothetical protein
VTTDLNRYVKKRMMFYIRWPTTLYHYLFGITPDAVAYDILNAMFADDVRLCPPQVNTVIGEKPPTQVETTKFADRNGLRFWLAVSLFTNIIIVVAIAK